MKDFLLYFLVLSCSKAVCQQIPYNKNYTLACHNCYDSKYAANIEDVFAYTTAIEIDIWDNEIGSGTAGILLGKKLDQDWYVKHNTFHKGNQNCCGGTLRHCLDRIKKWGDNHPLHNVITVFLDKKENWCKPPEKRQPADLDQLIVNIFPIKSLYTPFNLLGNKTSLKQAVIINWPTLDSLRGKFIFVITDGTSITHRKPLNEYLEAVENDAICFVAPEISSKNEISQPNGFTRRNAANVVFYNLKYPSILSEEISLLNYLSRIYDSPETKRSYSRLICKKANFVALFNYKLSFTIH